MSYVIYREMGRLTLFHYYLSTDGEYHVATNSAKRFETRKEAIEYGKQIIKSHPFFKLYALGPRKGQWRIK